MSVLGLAGYRCHTSVRCKSGRPRRGGNRTVGVRGSGEPGEDGGCRSVENGRSFCSV